MKNILKKLSRLILLCFFLLVCNGSFGQVKLCSWNIQHLGKSKSDTEIEFIANTLGDCDIIAIQEVVAGDGGAQAVARLADELNRKGAKWDYIISDPTNSNPYAAERYAYLWKTAKVKQNRKAWLEKEYEPQIDREPYYMDFSYNGKIFTLVNFHAIPKKKQPETEIKYFKFLPGQYSSRNLVFLGDFNVPQWHSVFNPLKKMGYKPVLVNQKTTIKMNCTATTCLASEFDNIFYNVAKTALLDSGVLHFHQNFPDMKAARQISDHIPVWAEIDFAEGKIKVHAELEPENLRGPIPEENVQN